MYLLWKRHALIVAALPKQNDSDASILPAVVPAKTKEMQQLFDNVIQTTIGSNSWFASTGSRRKSMIICSKNNKAAAGFVVSKLNWLLTTITKLTKFAASSVHYATEDLDTFETVQLCSGAPSSIFVNVLHNHKPILQFPPTSFTADS